MELSAAAEPVQPQAISQPHQPKGKRRLIWSFLSGAVYISALLTAAAGVAYGQFMLSEDIVLQLFRTKRYFTFDPSLSSVFPGVALFIVSGVLLAVAGRRPFVKVMPKLEKPAWSGSLWLPAAQLLTFFVGLGLAIYLAKNLGPGAYRPTLPLLLIACLVLFAIAFLLNDLRHGIFFAVAWRQRLKVWLLLEIVYITAMAAMFVYLNVKDLTAPYYAAIGDEYSFFNVAKQIALGPPANLFSQKGVYGYHPVADSAYQAFVMNNFGINNFGWKLSGVLITVVTLFPLYLFTRQLFGSWAAAIASAITATSHYLFAYVHTGYNNVHSVTPTVLAAAAAGIGISRRSSVLLFLAGSFAGLGFYTFFSARFAIVALILAVLVSEFRRSTIRLLFAAVAGFAVAVYPMFAVNGMEVLTAMVSNSIAKGNPSWQAIVEEAARRSWHSLLGFNYSTATVHYISGSLLDPVSAALWAVGAVVALLHVSDWRYRFLIIWIAIGLFVTAGFYKGDNIADTRIMVLVPFTAVLAGVAAARFISALSWHAGSRVFQAAAPPVMVALLLATFLFANLQRFWSITPSRLPTRPEPMAAKAVLSADVDRSIYASPVVVAPAPDALARLVFDSYDMGSRYPILLNSGQRASVGVYTDSPLIVFIETSQEDEKRIFASFKQVAPEASLTEEWNPAHMSRIGMILNPRPVPSAKSASGGTAKALKAVMRLGGLGRAQGKFFAPRDAMVDGSGNLYVADGSNNRVQKFDARGNALAVFGGATGTNAFLKAPVSVAVDSSGGIAVLDAGALDIKRFDADGRFLGAIGRDLNLVRPRSITSDGKDSFYIADVERVTLLSKDGQVRTTYKTGHGGDNRIQFREPADVALDAAGHIFVVDGATGNISRLDSQGKLVHQWGSPARGAGNPPRLDIMPDGSLIVLVPEARRVLRYRPDGQQIGDFSGNSLIGERFEAPVGLAVDKAGLLYIADAGFHQLVKFALID